VVFIPFEYIKAILYLTNGRVSFLLLVYFDMHYFWYSMQVSGDKIF